MEKGKIKSGFIELYQNVFCSLCNYEFTARILINDLNKDFAEVNANHILPI